MKPQILTALTAIGGIILGAVFSVIAYQYKAEKEKKTSLLELLAELLKMNEVLYDMTMPLKHDMVKEYLNQYMSFFNRTYHANITVETFPGETRNAISVSFQKDLELSKIDFSDEDWTTFFNSLNRIKGYYPILYTTIWRDKKNIQIFRELIKSLPERINNIREAFQKDFSQMIPLSQDYYAQESLRNLSMIQKIFQSKLCAVAKHVSFFTYLKVKRIINRREKMMEKGYDFSFLEDSWKKAIDDYSGAEATRKN